MAPSVPNVKTVARPARQAAERTVARALPLLSRVQAARRLDPSDWQEGDWKQGEWAVDPWRPAASHNTQILNVRHAVRRGQNLTRRAVGLGVLLVLTLLGTGAVVVALLLLGVGLAAGSDVAGGLMVFTLLLALSGAWLAARRAAALLHPAPAPELPAAALEGASRETAPDAEARLLQTLRVHERALPAQARAAFHATVIATRDALRATAPDAQMNRDAFDARQAACEDLPELLDAYRAVPRDPRNDAQLLEQLALIHTRMSRITRERAAQSGDKLAAHGHYLRGKYEG